MRTGWWIELGRTDYVRVHDLQRRCVQARAKDTLPDVFLATEHDSVLTLGRGTDPANVLVDDIPIVEAERGGDVTYHGPGQVVVYPIVNLRAEERDLHAWLRKLEEIVLLTLNELGLRGRRESGKTGVWIGPRKVASIGVAVSRWVTYHGLSLNVATELGAFDRIRPCGLDSRVMTSMEQQLGRSVSIHEVETELRRSCEFVLEHKLERRSPVELERALDGAKG